jgi:hypothetical protein
MKPDATWFGEYASAYVQSTLAGSPNAQASRCRKSIADTEDSLPGSPNLLLLL